MSEIRFKKMFCLGLIGENDICGGFEAELTFIPEIKQYFIWKYAPKCGCVLFINKEGKPIFIRRSDMSADEIEYYGV